MQFLSSSKLQKLTWKKPQSKLVGKFLLALYPQLTQLIYICTLRNKFLLVDYLLKGLLVVLTWFSFLPSCFLCPIFFHNSPKELSLKNYRKCFFYHLKPFFGSWDIQLCSLSSFSPSCQKLQDIRMEQLWLYELTCINY